jgi:hypothetical protein
MANTFVKIQTVTVGSGGAATIDFTSIPQTYTDLKVVLSTRDAYAGIFDGIKITFNSNTTGYSWRYVEGTGAAVSSGNASSQAFGQGGVSSGANATASVFGSQEVYIPNYTSSNNKSFSAEGVQEHNGATGYAYLFANLWANTAAITSISITPYQPVNFVQYTSATLYGIKSS